MKRLVILFLILSFKIAFGQVPSANQLVSGPSVNKTDLTNEIDGLIGDNDIMNGIKMQGINYGFLVMDKTLDAVFKTIATGTVYSAPAAKIMQIRAKMKSKKLSKEIHKLRDTFHDGASRLNKIEYQKFKIKYAYAKSHNEVGSDFKRLPIHELLSAQQKTLYGQRVQALILDDAQYNPRNKYVINKYGPKHWSYGHIFLPAGQVGYEDDLKALNVVMNKNGKTTFLSSYDRMKIAEIQSGRLAKKKVTLRKIAEESYYQIEKWKAMESKLHDGKYFNSRSKKRDL